MKIKKKEKVEVLKSLIKKSDGVVISKYIKEELKINPSVFFKFNKNPISFFFSNLLKVNEMDKIRRINKHLSEEEKSILSEKLGSVPKNLMKALTNPVCKEELEIKYGLYDGEDELQELIRKANKKINVLTKMKRGIKNDY